MWYSCLWCQVCLDVTVFKHFIPPLFAAYDAHFHASQLLILPHAEIHPAHSACTHGARPVKRSTITTAPKLSCCCSYRGLLSLADADKSAEVDRQNPDSLQACHPEAAAAENTQSTSPPQQGRHSAADHGIRFAANTGGPDHCLRHAGSLKSLEQSLL